LPALLSILLLAQVSIAQQLAASKAIGLRIIVVGTEPEAQQILQRLNNGDDFERLRLVTVGDDVGITAVRL